VPALAGLARLHTQLEPPHLAHLQRLVASWALLADFCFSDLLLFVPTDESAEKFVVLGQIRPTTSQTLHREDLLGQLTDEVERPLVGRSYRLGEIIEGEVTDPLIRERVRVLCIPVRWRGQIVGVLSREAALVVGRSPGELERTYVDIFNRFARMIAAGEFPFTTEDSTTSTETVRVGDGCLLLDRSARVEYASPNAVSALHSVGVHANADGMRLGEIGLEDEVLRTAFDFASPATAEVEGSSGAVVVIRCIPMLDHGKVSGAVVLLRDVSELRRRDRLLLSKDATIREIHHRVKNNLQTISSLLRLQGRRMAVPEAKRAIEESVRRIRSISLVHDFLSREAGEDVPFVDILRPLVQMVKEGLVSSEAEVRFALVGDAGTLPAAVATPMAVVVNELLQNVMDHAFADGDDQRPAGLVRFEMANDGRELLVRVTDDGVGLPEGFTVGASHGLGLTIVRALVTGDLGGTIDMFEPTDGSPGTVVEVRVPLDLTRPG
jgi:two-component sensor histidine kinase